MKKKINQNSQIAKTYNGFTLIELLVIIIILGLLVWLQRMIAGIEEM